ncbi:MAG: LysR family transcriptional regulator [Acidobacteria bacterium]|nr:LysR family transcriptional regulator [Acidobacteriota bacterium]
MDIFDLETFRAVAQEGSFSRAAQKLGRTQPAVSQAIRKLELEIEEPLFDRSSRDGTLTDAGEVLLEYAERLLNLRGEARVALRELRENQRGKLSLAANEFTCLYLLPVLHRFRHLHPMIQIEVRRSLASRIPNELLRHAVELGVLSFRPDDPLLHSIVVFRDELAFVVHPRHPLARKRAVKVRQLGSESFVAHNVPSPYRIKVVQAFQQCKTPLHMGVELPTIEAIKKFVTLGNGVALVPGICVENEVRRGELIRVPVRDLSLERKLRIVYRKAKSLSHAARAFLRVAESIASEGGPYLFIPEH